MGIETELERRIPATRGINADVDPYLAYCSELLGQRERAYLEEKSQEIRARYMVLHDGLRDELKRIQNKFEALSDLAALEIDLEYLDLLLKDEQFKEDELLQIEREIVWREHLAGIMKFNGYETLEICRTEIRELPYIIIIGDKSINEACQWKNVSFEEGLTYLPINARKTRISLGVVAPAAIGVPICTVLASSSLARRRIATGEEIVTTPTHHKAFKYAIEEFESLKLRRIVTQKEMSVDFLRGMYMDVVNLSSYMFLALKNYLTKTTRTPWLVGMQTWGGKIKALVKSKWFYVALIVIMLFVLAIGQSLGWWDFPIFRQIFGVHK